MGIIELGINEGIRIEQDQSEMIGEGAGIHIFLPDARSSVSSCVLPLSGVFKPMYLYFLPVLQLGSPSQINDLSIRCPAKSFPPAAQTTARAQSSSPNMSTSMRSVALPSLKSTMLPSRMSPSFILSPHPSHPPSQVVPHQGLHGRRCRFLHGCVCGRVIESSILRFL